MVLYASVVDENGTVLPEASHSVRFTIEGGDAELIGKNPIEAEAGIAAVLLRAKTQAGNITVSASGNGLEEAELNISVAGNKGPKL